MIYKYKHLINPLISVVKPHEHWHEDISYLNIRGTFFFLCDIIDPDIPEIIPMPQKTQNNNQLNHEFEKSN